MYRFYRQFKHCVDGAIAQGVDDKIQRLWTENCSSLTKMIELTNKDKDFKVFIWDHLTKESLSKENIKQIVCNARNNCPKTASKFCSVIISEFGIRYIINEDMKILQVVIITFLLSGCATTSNIPQTVEFRHFIRDFFNDRSFQLQHVRFPAPHIHYGANGSETGGTIVTTYIENDNWKHLSGPDYYKCQINCFDVVIYDNFSRKHGESNKRVLSFEGVNNGINSSLYFERINGQWFLVKLELLDN